MFFALIVGNVRRAFLARNYIDDILQLGWVGNSYCEWFQINRGRRVSRTSSSLVFSSFLFSFPHRWNFHRIIYFVSPLLIVISFSFSHSHCTHITSHHITPSGIQCNAMQCTWPAVLACRIRYREGQVAHGSHDRHYSSRSRSISLLHRRNHIRTCSSRSHRASSFLSIQVFPSWPCCEWCQISSECAAFPRVRHPSNCTGRREPWTSLIPEPRPSIF